MRHATVVCLDDLTHDTELSLQTCLYDLVRAPIWHAAGIDIGTAPRTGAQHNLAAGFRHDDFLSLCGLPTVDPATLHHRLPAAAADMLAAALPAGALAMGSTMPPWLTTLLRSQGLPWLDLRLSPLTFGDDAFVELRTEDPALKALIEPFALGPEFLLTAACLHAAAVRRSRRETPGLPRLDDALVFVPQALDDTDLIDADRGVASLDEQARTLRDLASQRRLFCLPGQDAVHQRLMALVGQPIPLVADSLSELLAMDDTVAFVGLNAPALHQARWYGKESLALWPHGGWVDDAQAPLVVPAHALLSEPLWAALLTGSAPRPGAVRLPPQRDRLRALLGLAAWPASSAASPAATPAAAGAQTATPSLEIERQRIDDLKLEIEGLKEALRVVLRQTALRSAMLQTPEPAHG